MQMLQGFGQIETQINEPASGLLETSAAKNSLELIIHNYRP